MTWLILASAVVPAASILALLWTAPRWLVPRLAARARGCLYAVPTRARAVALTLDDGPDAQSTPEILRLLQANDARATFFVIASHVLGQEALVARIVEEGHELGNHLTRDEPSVNLSPDAFSTAMLEAGVVLGRFAPVRWLRPGSAWHNRSMIDRIERAGYRCALGSVYPYDPYVPSARFAAAYILSNLRAGAVIILHERGARGRRTAETLRRVLPPLRARGYQVLTLSELEAQRDVDDARIDGR